MHRILKYFLVAGVACSLSAAASAQSLSTLFASQLTNNPGGTVFFDLRVGPQPIRISALDVNTTLPAGHSFGCQVYTHPGFVSGTELTPASWTLQASGIGTAAGLNHASSVSLGTGITLPANTRIAFAIAMGAQAGVESAAAAFTVGDTSNHLYQNSDLQINLGSVTSDAFAGTLSSSRVWNGTVYYHTSSGGCTLEDGTCSLAPDGATCAAWNGVYRGDFTDCSGATLPCTALVNGGFETSYFTGWDQFGDTGFTGVDGSIVTPHSGQWAAYFGPQHDVGGITQVIPAPAGAPLEVSFWYQSIGTPQSFSADLDGVPLVAFADDTQHSTWTHFTFVAVAARANPVLRFSCLNVPDYVRLDDIRVCVGGGSSCYPNCDQSTVAPVLNANDFQCFLNKFAAGCPE